MGKGHFTAMDLSEDAQVIVHAGFLAGKTLAQIVQAVQAATGEAIASSSLGNYRAWWKTDKRRMLEAREIVKEAAAAVKLLPPGQMAEVVDQKLEAFALLVMDKLEGDDPKTVLGLVHGQRRLDIARERNEIRRTQVEIEKQLADLERRKVELREKAAAVATRVEEKVKAAGKTLDPEVARMIKEEIYGLGA